jgi:hypothetical protein
VTPLLAAALAAFVVELAKSAGHDTGIRLVAALGPHLTPETAARLWSALVAACQKHLAGDDKALPALWADDAWGGLHREWAEESPGTPVPQSDTPGGDGIAG